jgi:hypothetical protein
MPRRGGMVISAMGIRNCMRSRTARKQMVIV